MLTTYLILFFSVLAAATGQIVLKKGMLILGPQELDPRSIIFLIKAIFTNIYVFLGVFFYFLSFITWMFVLSKMKLSAAYPFVSLVYIFVIAGSYIFFKDRVR